MRKVLIRVAMVLALSAAVACDRSNDGAEPTNAPAAVAEPGRGADAEQPAERRDETTGTLPDTAGPLPLALSIATAALSGALVLRYVRRRSDD
jgi:hypothetical protein